MLYHRCCIILEDEKEARVAEVRNGICSLLDYQHRPVAHSLSAHISAGLLQLSSTDFSLFLCLEERPCPAIQAIDNPLFQPHFDKQN